MKIFEGNYKNFNKRILSSENIGYFLIFIFYSFVIYRLNLNKYYSVIIEIILFFIFISIAFYSNKIIFIQMISFDESTISLKGEKFNDKWQKELDIKETKIELKTISSRQGLRSVIFYIKLKNKKDNYIVNAYKTFSDQQIIEIFNEFKTNKGEKIIVDEKLIILRIQEKIKKCQ